MTTMTTTNFPVFTLYTANVTGDKFNTTYATKRVVTNVEEFADAMGLDHVAAEFVDFKRSVKNFISSNVIVFSMLVAGLPIAAPFALAFSMPDFTRWLIILRPISANTPIIFNIPSVMGSRAARQSTTNAPIMSFSAIIYVKSWFKPQKTLPPYW